jgi:hypothetical protein
MTYGQVFHAFHCEQSAFDAESSVLTLVVAHLSSLCCCGGASESASGSVIEVSDVEDLCDDDGEFAQFGL